MFPLWLMSVAQSGPSVGHPICSGIMPERQPALHHGFTLLIRKVLIRRPCGGVLTVVDHPVVVPPAVVSAQKGVTTRKVFRLPEIPPWGYSRLNPTLLIKLIIPVPQLISPRCAPLLTVLAREAHIQGVTVPLCTIILRYSPVLTVLGSHPHPPESHLLSRNVLKVQKVVNKPQAPERVAGLNLSQTPPSGPVWRSKTCQKGVRMCIKRAESEHKTGLKRAEGEHKPKVKTGLNLSQPGNNCLLTLSQPGNNCLNTPERHNPVYTHPRGITLYTPVGMRGVPFVHRWV